jgi:UDP-glucose 4-epimerase
MKIFITGYKGFIGSNLVPLLKNTHTIRGWDIKSEGSIFDSEVEKMVKWADIVIHLAALTSVNKSFKNPEDTFYTNVLGTARIAQFCSQYKKKLIYPSSAAIYFPDLSPYAKSKAIAEDIIKSIMGKTDIVILRFYNVFGPYMNPDSGSIMYNFLTNKKLEVYGDGEQTRDFIHVKDVVEVIKDSIKKKWNGNIVDVGTGQSYSINYVAGLFSYFRNIPLEYKPPVREIKWSIADISMLKTLYTKPLKTNLEKDLEELCI